MLQGQIQSVFFSWSFSSRGTHWGTLFETSVDYALCCMINHGITLVQLLCCLSLSSCHIESTLPPAAQLLLSQSQQGDLVGHHLWLLNILERISFNVYPMHWVLLLWRYASSRLSVMAGFYEHDNEPFGVMLTEEVLRCWISVKCWRKVFGVNQLII
jgi:hypothetical protein